MIIQYRFHSITFFRSEVSKILMDAHTELQSLKLSEISLNVSKDTEDNAVSLDMQEQLFDAISTLKEKIGLIGYR